MVMASIAGLLHRNARCGLLQRAVHRSIHPTTLNRFTPTPTSRPLHPMMPAFAALLHLTSDAAAKSESSSHPFITDGRTPTTNAAFARTRRDLPALLDPLDAGLRDELLKYGDLVQATYDGFDRRHWSPYCGTCLHGLRRLLPAVGLAGHGYVATAFLYATSDVDVPRWLGRPLHEDAWDGHANWMGYVAVAGAAEARRAGFRDVVVAWRGTISPDEWLLDMKTQMVLLEPLHAGGQVDEGAMVAEGFHSIYTSSNAQSKYGSRSAREQVAEELMRLVTHFRARGEEVRVTVTGHSLGGALAMLAARDAAAAHPDVHVSAVTFGAPRVGNRAFCDGVRSRGVRALRVVVRHDVVPTVPSVPGAVLDAPVSKPLGELWDLTHHSPAWAYMHVGDELELDAAKSPFLKHGLVRLGYHNLEACLHLLDGRESAAAGFRDGACRDVALVNKTSGMLRDELGIPEWWYTPANKGLRRDASGRWVLEREQDDLPVPDDRLPLSELD